MSSTQQQQQQETFKVLEHGTVCLNFSKPCKNLEFNHGENGQSFVVAGKTFSKLLQALEDVVPSAQLMTEMCAEIAAGTRDPLKDEVFFSRVVDTYSKKNQLRLEASVYRNKTYVFLKRFYLDKEFLLWCPSKVCQQITIPELPVLNELLRAGGAVLYEGKRGAKDGDKVGPAATAAEVTTTTAPPNSPSLLEPETTGQDGANGGGDVTAV